jgi:hypothetical protein
MKRNPGFRGRCARAGVATAAFALVLSGCAISRVSVSSGGTEGNGASARAFGVTDDGRYTVFGSTATNLVPNDTNAVADVFRRDEVAKTTIRVSVGDGGAQLASGAEAAAMTPDGRYIAFVTRDGIDPADTNASADAYVRDVVAGTTALASAPPAGGLPAGDVVSVAISEDARFVAFTYDVKVDDETGVASKVLRRDRQAGATTALTDWGYTNHLMMSRDGRHLAVSRQCYRCFPIPVLLDPDGSAAGWPALSFGVCGFDSFVLGPDGRFVVLQASGAVVIGNCLPKGSYLVDRTIGNAVALDLPGTNPAAVAVSTGARAVLFSAFGSPKPGGDPAQTHLFVRDRVRGNDVPVDFSVAAQIPDASTGNAALSDDGTAVAFASPAPDLVPGDHNGVEDVFVRPTGIP